MEDRLKNKFNLEPLKDKTNLGGWFDEAGEYHALSVPIDEDKDEWANIDPWVAER